MNVRKYWPNSLDMPILKRLISTSSELPALLMPIFVERNGSNSELIQRLDRSGKIVAFDPIQTDGQANSYPGKSISLEIGDSGAWAIAITGSDIRVSTWQETRDALPAMINQGLFTDCPMLISELIYTFELDSFYHNLHKIAFEYLRYLSKRGAHIWLDTALLLPSLKRELVSNLSDNDVINEILDNSRVVSSPRGMIAYIPPPARLPDRSDLPKTLALAKLCGISAFTAKRLKRSVNVKDATISWRIVGFGAAGRMVAKSRALNASTVESSYSEYEEISIARGQFVARSRPYTRSMSFYVFPSNGDGPEAIHTLPPDEAGCISVAINVRPHSLDYEKPAAIQGNILRQLSNSFDHFWVITNHRYDGVDTTTGMSNKAARHARACVMSELVLASEASPSIAPYEFQIPGGINVFAVDKWIDARSLHDNVASCISRLASHEFVLSGASSLHVFVPTMKFESAVTLPLGFDVLDVVVHSRPNNRREMFGFAIDVGSASSAADTEFAELCAFLLLGCGLRDLEMGLDYIVGRWGRKMLRIGLVGQKRHIYDLFKEEMREFDFVISGAKINWTIYNQLKQLEIEVIHVSSLRRYFAQLTLM